MGGSALKNTTVRRLDAPAFQAVSQKVISALTEAYPGARVAQIPAYRAKSDFGDLDVLITTEAVQAAGGGDTLKQLALDKFHSTDMFKNGNILSVDYRESADQKEPGFQVDIIGMPEIDFSYALDYFSYNDLGNLCGRCYHKAGLRHGHNGLTMPLRDGDYMFATIPVTRDFDRALEFMDFDPVKFRQGFDDLEEIFRYVVASSYFNQEIFLLENRNHISRVRDRKRKTYTEFLKWIADKPGLPAYAYPEDKSLWLPRIFEWFPEAQAEYENAMANLAVQRKLKERFNGELVARLTGLQGKELGMVMKRVKESFGPSEAFQDFVLKASDADIAQKVKSIQEAVV